MFGKPIRSSNKEFSNLDLLEFNHIPPSLNEQLTKAPLISPIYSPGEAGYKMRDFLLKP